VSDLKHVKKKDMRTFFKETLPVSKVRKIIRSNPEGM
jgi:hypothetical protein